MSRRTASKNGARFFFIARHGALVKFNVRALHHVETKCQENAEKKGVSYRLFPATFDPPTKLSAFCKQ